MGKSLVFGLCLLLVSSLTAFSTNSPLADAVEKGDRVRIQALVKGGASVNAAQIDGMSALHWAVYVDDLQTVTILIQSGAEVRASNRYGVTPLSLACMNGNAAIVELLLEAGADPNSTLRGGETALMTASRTGKPEAVKAMLAKGGDVNAKERRGQTALMWAAAEGHSEVLELLIEAGADIHANLPDSGFTPLFFAVREGHLEATRVLLQAGADVNGLVQPRKPSGKGPRPGTSPLILAVENGHFELALALLGAGADPNDLRSGFSALHTITWVRKPNRGDGDDGDPAPTGSGNVSSLEFVRKLVEYGASPNIQLKTGRSGRGQLSRLGATPFLLAAITDDAPLMRLLVELGANPKLTNADGATPLMAAAGLGTQAPTEEAGTEDEALEAVELMVKLGADVNAVDKNGETAMHGAAYKNLPRVVEFLATKGARTEIWNQKNKWGWTPLQIAEGYRPGNFKPSPETVSAFQRVMNASAETIP